MKLLTFSYYVWPLLISTAVYLSVIYHPSFQNIHSTARALWHVSGGFMTVFLGLSLLSFFAAEHALGRFRLPITGSDMVDRLGISRFLGWVVAFWAAVITVGGTIYLFVLLIQFLRKL